MKMWQVKERCGNYRGGAACSSSQQPPLHTPALLVLAKPPTWHPLSHPHTPQSSAHQLHIHIHIHQQPTTM